MNLLVGDVAGNVRRMIEVSAGLAAEGDLDLVVFPELALSGYPPEDLLFHAGFRKQVEEALAELQAASEKVAILAGYPEYSGHSIFNAAVLFSGGRRLAGYRKCALPNYSVFDEQRYFTPGSGPVVVRLNGLDVGIAICEDVWEPGPVVAAARAGAGVVVTLNGSPFELAKQQRREALLAQRARETGVPIIYANLVGGQDELVFDGGSCAVDAGGELLARAPAFAESVLRLSITGSGPEARVLPGATAPLLDEEASVYQALVTGVRDYVRKNGFPGVVLGLSGGIDSALTLAIAVDALGREAVQAVMMPYRYTSQMSLEDAQAQAESMNVDYRVIPIEPLVASAESALEPLFAGLPADTTEENLQSRSRGLLLMAISNKTGRMVLATGNKSEMAVGYATLYGDMAGGFAPIKDCPKSLVYRLARYRNRQRPVIPERVIERPPSAELRPDQQDSDSLPPYDVLDRILDALILEDRSVDEIAAAGLDAGVVARVLEMVRRAEYKRRQAPPGVRISSRAFGRDWRYPITSGYRH
ncbi:MAG: NAD+ synthase [Chromatiales bacterium]|nr:NAD+ synthase [Chromatiales bacterium]